MNEEDTKEESLICHLEALRQTLLKCLYAVAAVLPFTFFIAPKVLNRVIKIILGGADITLNYFSPVEVFLIQIKTAVVIDLIVCFPYIAKKIWDFLLPALYENEKKFIKTTVLFSSVLFVTGVCFCLFLIFPLVVKFGLSFSNENINPVFNISNIVTLAIWMSMAFGLMFQVPLITFYLIKSDFISYNSVADKRPYIIIAMLITAGILTPPDIISQLMLALPAYILFEAGLLFAKKNLE